MAHPDPRNELLDGWAMELFNQYLDSRFMRLATPILKNDVVDHAMTANVDDLRDYVNQLFAELNRLLEVRTEWKTCKNPLAFYCTPSTKPRPQTREAQQLANSILTTVWLLLQLKPILKGKLIPA